MRGKSAAFHFSPFASEPLLSSVFMVNKRVVTPIESVMIAGGKWFTESKKRMNGKRWAGRRVSLSKERIVEFYIRGVLLIRYRI